MIIVTKYEIAAIFNGIKDMILDDIDYIHELSDRPESIAYQSFSRAWAVVCGIYCCKSFYVYISALYGRVNELSDVRYRTVYATRTAKWYLDDVKVHLDPRYHFIVYVLISRVLLGHGN